MIIKNTFHTFLFCLLSFLLTGQNNGYQVVVKKVKISKENSAKLPALHSFSMATFYDDDELYSHESKNNEINLLLVGGRKNGLHHRAYNKLVFHWQ